MRTAFLAALFTLLAVSAAAQQREPVIDMHLHAFTADQQGPPPLAMCTPIAEFPAWDPAKPYAETFMAVMKNPACEDPVWSPETDEEVMQQTIDAMERRNVIGVLSGPPDRVATWMAAAPDRFIPGLGVNVANTEITPDSLRGLVESGRVEVLADAHPQVYVDIGVIVFTRPDFYTYLRRIVEAGHANRVMFGSDQMVWPGVIERAITRIEKAPFLTEQQKRDILYNNAARFLRLSEEDVAAHRSM